MTATPRVNSRPEPATVIACVRELLGWDPIPEPAPSPVEALPLDPLADIEATRRVLARLRRLTARSYAAER